MLMAFAIIGKEEGTMFWKKKDKTVATEKGSKCPVCGVDCFDANSLGRHTAWAHKEEKAPAK